MKFNSHYFLANVSQTHVHAHVYERLVNLHRTVLRKKYYHQTCRHVLCFFVVDPDHHILAWLKKVMHNDRKCILSVLICSPGRLLFKIIKKSYSFRASALLAENNEIADQMLQLHCDIHDCKIDSLQMRKCDFLPRIRVTSFLVCSKVFR